MPDACDRVTDLQIDIGAAFMDRRALLAAVALPVRVSTVCITCAAPIPVGRLRAAPGAVRCVGCQGRIDRQEGAAWNC
jgi:RNA polymerase-binding transcription factor DksA